MDPVPPSAASLVFREIFIRLDRSGVLNSFRSYANSILVILDGIQYFSSDKIHCDKCQCRELSNGKTNYYHGVLTPVIAQPGNEHVIPLAG
jgi:hypothetical protein